MLQLLKNIIKRSELFYRYKEWNIWKSEKQRFINESIEYLENHEIEDSAIIRKAYLRDMKKYRFSFNEWSNQYELFDKDDTIKSTFISRSEAQKCYRSIIKPEWRDLFHDKVKFLNFFKVHIHREYIFVDKLTPRSEVIKMLQSKPTIIKPTSGSLGVGVFKVTPHDIKSEKEQNRILDIIYADKTLVEECIQGCEEIQKFHPESLNSIRVVTMRDSKHNVIRCFGAFLRLGRGDSVVDNAHAGGIFAHINVSSGIVDSDGLSTDGSVHQIHPDSELRIKGFHMPQWKEILDICIESHNKCPNFVIGWDVVVNSNGQIEFIEGNHAPDMDLMQSTIKKGCRVEFIEAFNRYKL